LLLLTYGHPTHLYRLCGLVSMQWCCRPTCWKIKAKHATVKSQQVHNIHFTSNNTVTAVHPPTPKLAIMLNPEPVPSTSNPNNPSPQDPCYLYSHLILCLPGGSFSSFHHHSSVYNPCLTTLATCTNHSSLIIDDMSACRRSCIQNLSLRPKQMQVGKYPYKLTF